jgi:uncharacterized membrane protein YqjE
MSEPSLGLFASLRGLAATAVGLLRTRIELLVTEFEEEKLRIAGLFGYGLAAVLMLLVGAVFLAVFVTVLLWDSNRLLVLGVFAALFLGGGLLALMVALRLARTPSRLFSASLAELGQDRSALEPTE